MNPSSDPTRRRRRPALDAEGLEPRQLLTSNVGNTIALVKASVAQPGATTAVPFTIDPTHFTRPKGRMVIGIDVAATTGSQVQPLISSVTDPHGNTVNQAIHSIYNPHLPQGRVASGSAGTEAVLAPLVSYPGQPDRPVTYTANVTGKNNTSGGLLLDFYLPGDANGDGVVDRSDLNAVRAAMNTTKDQKGYNPSADANRDGRIGRIDLAYAQQNQGVRTTISPVISANLDPATDTGLPDRKTASRVVHFYGAATPGSTLEFTEITGNAPSATATADANGLYNVNLTLGNGLNTFHVKATDPFGQVIEGNLSPVIFDPNAPAASASS